MACSTVCAAASGGIIAAVTIGGSCALALTPALLISSDRPENQGKILNSVLIVTMTAVTVGAGLGILVSKVARYTCNKIIGNQ